MRILVLSDLHIEHGPRWSLPDDLPPHDVVVLAGDIHSPPSAAVEWATAEFAPLPVVYVHGNHEFYGRRIDGGNIAIAQAMARGTNVHFLNRSSVVIGGARFVGVTLWTDYALYGDPRDAMSEAERFLNDHRLIYIDDLRFMPSDALERHRADIAFIESELSQPFDGPTVVVTHHAPHPGSVAQQFVNDPLTPAFVSDLMAIIERHAPALWVHGHMHNPSDYMVGETHVVCNPKGYGPHSPGGLPENTEFEMKIIEVDV